MGGQHEVMTLCQDKCGSQDCKSYNVPLHKCFSPPKLWPNDETWGSGDTLDTVLNSTHISRQFFASQDGNSVEDTDTGFILPLEVCIGPFGKPRPWGSFKVLTGTANPEL